MWDDIVAQIDASVDEEPGMRVLPKPTDETLDAFEQSEGVTLPRSYREYAKVFGPGELAGLYRIAVPVGIPKPIDLRTLNHAEHHPADTKPYASFGPPEFIAPFYFFCGSGGGDSYAWRTDEVTSPVDHEYAIYEFGRMPPAVRVADTFADFVRNYILTEDEARGWEPEFVFYPSRVKA